MNSMNEHRQRFCLTDTPTNCDISNYACYKYNLLFTDLQQCQTAVVKCLL